MKIFKYLFIVTILIAITAQAMDAPEFTDDISVEAIHLSPEAKGLRAKSRYLCTGPCCPSSAAEGHTEEINLKCSSYIEITKGEDSFLIADTSGALALRLLYIAHDSSFSFDGPFFDTLKSRALPLACAPPEVVKHTLPYWAPVESRFWKEYMALPAGDSRSDELKMRPLNKKFLASGKINFAIARQPSTRGKLSSRISNAGWQIASSSKDSVQYSPILDKILSEAVDESLYLTVEAVSYLKGFKPKVMTPPSSDEEEARRTKESPSHRKTGKGRKGMSKSGSPANSRGGGKGRSRRGK